MENFIISAGAIAPMFLIIALGYVLRRLGIISEEFALAANKIAFQVFLPCLLFINIYTADIHTAVDARLMIFTFVACVVSFAVIWLAVTAFCKDNFRRGVIIQGMYRSNFVILGLPVATNICGPECGAVIGLLLAIVLPCYNVFSVIALEVFNGKHLLEISAHTANLDKSSAKRIVRQIVTNPLIIATALAFICVVLKIRLPKIILQPLNDLAAVAPALCLIILGAFLRFSGVYGHIKELVSVILVRLIIMPTVMVTLAVMAGFTGVNLVSLLAIFATPTATAGFTMVKIIGGDGDLAANIVVFTSFLSMFTMFVFTYILISMGLV